MNRTRLAAPLLLLSVFSVAAADQVTAAASTEANALARQYTGRVCRDDIELDTDTFRQRLNAAQIKEMRTKIVNEWRKDLAEDAREDGYTYEVRYRDNRVWYWKRDVKGGKGEFGVVTINATGKRELTCDQ